MAKDPLMTELMAELHNTEFGIVPPGRHQIQDIYAMVQSAYPHLCDDNAKCQHGGGAINQPEWRHRVQGKLGYLKRKGRRVSKPGPRGYWDFD